MHSVSEPDTGGSRQPERLSKRPRWISVGAAAYRRLLVEIAVVAFRRSTRNLALSDLVERIFRFNCLGVRLSPLQYREELLGLLEIVNQRQPRAVIEIGTYAGGTLSLLTRCAAADATVISIDLPAGEFGGGYATSRSRLYRSFATNDQRVELIRADSHSEETRDRVVQLLGVRPVDVLFIDGDHTIEGVRRDLELYGPLLAEDGVVAFHDIVPGPHASVGGVPTFWAELRAGHAVRELVRDWSQGEAGIGIIEAAEVGALPGFTPPER
jgi:predicted O-methyltransferase YrrM